MKYLLQDENGTLSKTATIYVVTMVLIWIKFILAGLTIHAPFLAPEGHTFGELDPELVGALVAASGAIYAWRRGQDFKAYTEKPTEDVETKLNKMLEP